MLYLLVVVIAAAVGAIVYLMSLQAGPYPDGGGFGSEPESAPTPPAGGAYVPVSTSRPDWQTRLTGFLGLLILVVVGSVVLAVALYVSVSLLIALFGGASDGGSAT